MYTIGHSLAVTFPWNGRLISRAWLALLTPRPLPFFRTFLNTISTTPDVGVMYVTLRRWGEGERGLCRHWWPYNAVKKHRPSLLGIMSVPLGSHFPSLPLCVCVCVCLYMSLVSKLSAVNAGETSPEFPHEMSHVRPVKISWRIRQNNRQAWHVDTSPPQLKASIATQLQQTSKLMQCVIM
ncbi:hypothetical protein LZ32DRAFT_116640 [Colletotrichum eremochloae]|nr:hypothetical protein LZ32DRAFT_116640 [Colletotrichum eremochloae]